MAYFPLGRGNGGGGGGGVGGGGGGRGLTKGEKWLFEVRMSHFLVLLPITIFTRGQGENHSLAVIFPY